MMLFALVLWLLVTNTYIPDEDIDMEFLIFLCVIAAHTLSQRQAVLSVEVRIQRDPRSKCVRTVRSNWVSFEYRDPSRCILHHAEN